MALRSTVLIVALLLFAGEGVCTALCAPEADSERVAHASSVPPCHETAPEPQAPPAEHDCHGPCEVTLTATSPELSSPGTSLATGLAAAPAPRLPARHAAPGVAAPERLPPGPAPFLLNASFLL